MTEKEIISKLVIDDLQEPHRQIAESIGLESFLKLVSSFGGSAIYIPQMKEIVKNRVYQMIQDEFDGTNIKTLANKYNVSESTVYNVVREQLKSGIHRHPNIPGQMSIADIFGTGEK
ncbi:MAG: Mor transcription activator family protein [Lachnospiraceae bacterium]|nr:Mor transcription activator family protein [Lachnospiraceae bacterium]